MIIYCGSDSLANRLNKLYPANLAGNLISPKHWKKAGKIRTCKYALDNGAWISFKNKLPWDEAIFIETLNLAARQTIMPDFVVCPDVVGDSVATTKLWKIWYPRLKDYGWRVAFAAQDGHELSDIPDQANLVFLGGSTEWKLRNVAKFCKNFPTHVARVNTYSRLWLCHNAGAISVDGTGWTRKGFFSKESEPLHQYLAKFSGVNDPSPQLALFESHEYVSEPTLNNQKVA